MNAETASTPLMRQYHAIKQQVPGRPAHVPPGRFLRALLRRRRRRRARARNHPHLPQQRKRHGHPHVRRALSRGRRLHRAPHRTRLSRRHLRSDGRSRRPARNWSGAKSRASSRPAPPPTRTCSARTRTTISPRCRATATRAGLAYVDVSTGEFRATELDLAELPALLESIGAREVLVAAEAPLLPADPEPQALDRHRTGRLGLQRRLLRPHPARTFPSALARWLRPRRTSPRPSRAAGAVLHYLRDTQRAALDHLDPPEAISTAPKPWCSTPSPCAISN